MASSRPFPANAHAAGGGGDVRVSAAELRRGLRRGELLPYYQPQVALPSRRVVGVEALVRWQHAEYGLLSPASFLPAIEATPLAIELDRYVLERVLTDVASWGAGRSRRLRVAVNVSVRSLEAEAPVAWIAALRGRHHLPPGGLEIEITESAAYADGRRVTSTLERLREAGVGIALDDFGTGYSMLDRLRELPFDALKIDRSFVTGLGARFGPQLLLAAISLGHALGLRVVAEGVEDERELGFLAKHGCDEVQGYLFGRPMPGPALLARLADPPAPGKPSDDAIPAVFGTDDSGLERLIRPLLSELARLTDLESTYLTMIDREAGEQVILYARNRAALRIDEGRRVAWEDTVCKRALETGVRCTSDVPHVFGDSQAARDLALRTYAGVPVLRDGVAWGTLCGASLHARSVGPTTLAVMDSFARLIAMQLDLNEWRVPGRRTHRANVA